MTISRSTSMGLFAVATMIAFASLISATPADARGRTFYSQDYKFNKPMHGFDGRAAGGYYCSYQRLPNRVCSIVNGEEKCKVKGWTLRQYCY